MEDVLYLVHTTNKYTKNWKELSAAKIENYDDQFPGVFLTIITKQNINKVQLFLDNTQILIFSRRLLEQKNYHINLRDYNGFINETNTYFPWNLKAAIKKINNHTHEIGNEVVFHDSIPIDYLCLVIDNLSPIVFNNMEVLNNTILPTIPIENSTLPDMTKMPFYCYPLEQKYSGIDPLPKSSRKFFVKMAKTCNVATNLSTDMIVHEIKKKIPYLYANRNKQNIEELKKPKRRRTIKRTTKQRIL